MRHRIISRVRDTKSVVNVLLELDTDEGIGGVSYVAAFTLDRARAVRALIDDLSEVVVGMDPTCVGQISEQMLRSITLIGRNGLALIAVSAVDIAAWDLLGKIVGRPLYQILGATRHRIPAYGSSALWLEDDIDELCAQAASQVERGFGALKVRVGRPDAAMDLAVVRAIACAVGPGVELLADANQAWSVPQALRMGRQLEELGVTCLEEPIDQDDLEGHAELTRSLELPIASGENLYGPAAFLRLLELRGADILTPDLARIGGVMGWRVIAALGSVWHRPLAPHLFPEVNVHLLASVPSGRLEHVDWAEPLFEEPIVIRDGHAIPPNKPGLGLAFDKSAVSRFAVE